MNPFPRIRRSRPVRVIEGMIACFFEHQLSRAAAAWSFFLILSIFPFFICLSALLSAFHLDFPNLIAAAGRILPTAAAQFLEEYLNYVTTENSAAMLTAGALMMATSASAAFRTILNITGEVYGKMRYKQIISWISSFLYAFLFLLAVYVCIVVQVFGSALVRLIGRYILIRPEIYRLLQLRYPLVAVFIFVILYGLYRLTVPRHRPRYPVWLGAMGGAAAFMVVGVVYSALIDLSAKYSLVYGSLASVVVLMMWVYTCSYVIFAGAALNFSFAGVCGTRGSAKGGAR